MSTQVEIVVPKGSKSALKKRLGSLADVRLVSKPSQRDVSRVLMAMLEDLETNRLELETWLDLGRQLATSLPVVFLGPFGRASVSLAVVQAMAVLSKRVTSKKSDPYVAPTKDAAQRLVRAHRAGAEQQLIASASLEDGTLFVWSCEPRLYRVPAKEIPALADLDDEQLQKFDVSSSGSRLHWPGADVDINLDTIRFHSDPAYRRTAEAALRREASRYAKAIKTLRKKHALKQGDIAGLSERQVRRLEQGEAFPHAKTVEKLAGAHGMEVPAYLKELAKLSGTSRRRS